MSMNNFVIASYEKIAWFQRTANGWKRYAVENGTKGVRIEAGGDFYDIDGDGDPDVIIGEHRGKQEKPVVLFENVNVGAMWKQHVIDKGHKNTVDHHDGTQPVDLDGDGDLDITSIGWYNPKVWIYENK